MRLITDPRQLPAGFTLTPAERLYFQSASRSGPPFAVSAFYLSLADPTDPEDPIRRQCIPRTDEARRLSYELADPLGEGSVRAGPRLLHRYADRALLLLTDRCLSTCRHCFRRAAPPPRGRLSAAQLEATVRYLEEHPEVRELILSGGDPLTLADSSLGRVLERIRAGRPELALRIHTRAPVVWPPRVSRALAALLAAFRPLRVAVQVNHPRELSPQCVAALGRLRRRGLPLLGQTVLLRGVNDRLDVLASLMRGLAAAGVRPYYLFQGDLAAGTGHLRVPLGRGLALMRALKAELSPQELPVYALDRPGGGGKVALDRRRVARRGRRWYRLAAPPPTGRRPKRALPRAAAPGRTRCGSFFLYPAEGPLRPSFRRRIT